VSDDDSSASGGGLEPVPPSLADRVRGMLGLQGRETWLIRGFRVVLENSRPDIASADVLHRLDEALELIERHQPWRLRHMRRDLSHFVVVRFPSRGAYFPADRSCLTELTFLARRDITAAPVASSIVHEGIHARVDNFRRHFGSMPVERDMAREERLSRKAELDFGLSLPHELGLPVIERARASLALSDEEVAPSIDWRVAQARQEAVDRKARG
jgi:hypothetical protein